jgi:CsoR family transcriptional regulator, copper-sensing transcriptional repressor
MEMGSEDDADRDLLNRMKRIEGQIRGLQRMLSDDEDCSELIAQICAARNALDSLGAAILARRIGECLSKAGDPQSRAGIQQALSLFMRVR